MISTSPVEIQMLQKNTKFYDKIQWYVNISLDVWTFLSKMVSKSEKGIGFCVIIRNDHKILSFADIL